MSFNEYWKEKAAKRRKSWAGKAKRFADRHMLLEAIRSEVVYGHMKTEAVRSLRDEHRTVQNPIARWDSNMHFSFSEQGLREAMQAEGADVSSLTMTLSKKHIVGQQPHDIEYGDMLDVASNRRDLYEKYTDLETCAINYREVTMVIYRYTYLQQPFGLYELVPCKQLSISDLRLEETSFSTLNIATFLMEMAAEWELRREELNYHAKKLKLRTMEAATTDSIEFELWDDKKLQKKLEEYAVKEYSIDQVLGQVLSPWEKAVGDFIKAVTERDIKDDAQVLNARNCFYNLDFAQRFVNEKLRPYLDNHGLKEVIAFIPAHSYKQVVIEHKGYRVLIKHNMWPERFVLYPYAFDDKFLESDNNRLHLEMPKLTLSAIAEYLKQMPAINERIGKVIEKTKKAYRELQNKTE